MESIQSLLNYLNSQKSQKLTELATKKEKLIKRKQSFDSIKNFKPTFTLINEEVKKKEIDKLVSEVSSLDNITKAFSEEKELLTKTFSKIFEAYKEKEREKEQNLTEQEFHQQTKEKLLFKV